MKMFFKELEEERKEKFLWTRHGQVVILSTAATTTDKQSSNYEFSLFFNFHISLFWNPEFTQYLFSDCSPYLPQLADIAEHSEKGMKKM